MGSTIVWSASRCLGPMRISTYSRVTASIPGCGSASKDIVAWASSVVRPGSTAHSTVRDAW